MAHICDTSTESSPVHNEEHSAGVISSDSGDLTIHICPSTGGQMEMRIAKTETVEGLQKTLARKLKLPKERISLLYRDRLLKEGQLSKHEICDGSRLTLIPNVESGLLSQRTEQTNVLQALEGLSENQVNDFLSGKSPLTLAMRLGDHMMFVQLQLSTSPSGCKRLPKAMASRKAPLSAQSSASATNTPPVPVVVPAQTAPVPPSAGRFATGASRPHRMLSGRQREGPARPQAIRRRSSLAEASQNLSQKLQELTQFHQAPSASPPVVHNPSLSSQEKKDATVVNQTAKNPGAIIESMQHHGRGVYSGTFSGTLNPALQDEDGRPKRNISTIIHILNDLLGATPQYCGSGPTSPSLSPNPIHPTTSQTKGTHVTPPPSPTEENKVTRGKMEQIQSMLEQRRQRRKARRQARASPYSMWASNSKSRGVHPSQSEHPPHELDANMESSTMATNMDTESSAYPKLAQQTMVA